MVDTASADIRVEALLAGLASVCELLMDTNPHIGRELSIIAARCEELMGEPKEGE